MFTFTKTIQVFKFELPSDSGRTIDSARPETWVEKEIADAGDLHGSGVPTWYIIERFRRDNGCLADIETSLGVTLKIECPCCLGKMGWTATVECPGGVSPGGVRGCEHAVRVKCSTCQGQGVCRLTEKIRDDDGSAEWLFGGWDDAHPEKVRVPDVVLEMLAAERKKRGIGGDPNQIDIFAGSVEKTGEKP